MFKRLPLALLLLTAPAAAQNVNCTTRPPGDNSNACASTAFVQSVVVNPALTNGVTVITGGTSGYYLTDVAGILTEVPLPSSSMVVGSSTVGSGTSGALLYNNAGVLGNTTDPITLTGLGLNPANAGTISGDGASALFQNTTTTALALYSSGGLNFGPYSDLVRSTAVLNSGTSIDNYNAYGAYVQSTVAGGSSNNVVGYFDFNTSTANSAATWGINTLGTDSISGASAATSGRQVNGYEADFNIYSNNSGTIVSGVGVIGAFWNSEPTSAAAFLASISAGIGKWQDGYVAEPGCCLVGLNVGQTASSGTSLFSQPIYLTATDASAANHVNTITGAYQGSSGSLLFIDATEANGVSLVSGVSSVSPILETFGSDANISLVIATKGTSDIVVSTAGLLPASTNAINLGGPSTAWGAVYSRFYFAGSTQGVNCGPGLPTAAFTSVQGIVTHC